VVEKLRNRVQELNILIENTRKKLEELR
jgi:hypothetical protein